MAGGVIAGMGRTLAVDCSSVTLIRSHLSLHGNSWSLDRHQGPHVAEVLRLGAGLEQLDAVGGRGFEFGVDARELRLVLEHLLDTIGPHGGDFAGGWEDRARRCGALVLVVAVAVLLRDACRRKAFVLR